MRRFPCLTQWGSPPPMRGKGGDASKSAAVCGITPAYAGKRFLLGNCRRIPQDHPRLCGEKKPHSVGVVANRGSPPPMRGKVVDGDEITISTGITPAYAGKS